jgi:DNA anti-recombination protein RmuC
MTQLGYVVLGLALGVALGAVAVATWRRGSAAHTDRLEARLEVQSVELRRLADAAAARDGSAEAARSELAGARRALESLAVREEERRDREREHGEVVRRLSTVLAGGASKGRAGENVLREHLAELPPGMLVTDFRVNGRVVEFGLLLPDGRRLPVDSKWSALAELEALEAATDPAQRDALAREVEKQVSLRAREVAQYLDPSLTAPVAVAAIPDAAYAVLRRAHADAFGRGVVIVPYSTALPVLLFLYSLAGRFGDAGDAQACLAEVAVLVDAIEGVLENKFAKAGTMIGNGTEEMRSSLGKARASLARGRNPQVGAEPSEGVLRAVP